MNVDHLRRRVAARARRMRYQSHKLCETSFEAYMRAAWPILEPRTPLRSNWHHGLIAEYLMACKSGQIRRLIVNEPPRHLKSTEITVDFPTWIWTQEPWERFMFFSYAMTLSTKHSVDRRTLIESSWYQRGWHDRFQLSTDQNVKTEFTNTQRGAMVAHSMTGGGVGKGGRYLIVDDPHDPLKAQSDTERETDIQSFDQKISTRHDDPKTGVTIVVMQRLHEKDLSGHLLSTQRKDWTWLRIPLQAPVRVYIRYPISGKVKIRERGEMLHEARISISDLPRLKRQLGTYGFAGQMQQRPSPPGGSILKRAWWKYYQVAPARWYRKMIVVDCAFKDAEDSDRVCMEAWGQSVTRRERGEIEPLSEYYVLDEICEVMSFMTMLKTFRGFCARHRDITEKIIEEKANGAALISAMRKKIPGLIAWNPGAAGKIERARIMSPVAEAGNIYLPVPTPDKIWPTDFVEETAIFPRGAHDDRVDCASMAIIRFTQTEQGSFTGVHSAAVQEADGETPETRTLIAQPLKSEEPLW